MVMCSKTTSCGIDAYLWAVDGSVAATLLAWVYLSEDKHRSHMSRHSVSVSLVAC